MSNTATDVQNPKHLRHIGRRPEMGRYLQHTWTLRHFIFSQARFRSLSSGRGTYLGRLWLLLDPFLQVGMYYVIFGLVLNISRGMENFVAFLAIGIIIFRQLSGALTSGATLLTKNRSLVRGFAFPRFTVVLSDSLRGFFDSIPDILALLIFIWVIPPHAPPTWTWLLLPVVLLLLRIMVTGIMMITAYLSSVLPDTQHLWSIISRFWFYGSGVIFPVERYVSDPTFLTVIKANPAFVVLDASRSLLMDGVVPPISTWLQLVGWSLAILCFGLLLFWSREERYNRVL